VQEFETMPNLTYNSEKSPSKGNKRSMHRSAIIIATLLSFLGSTHAQGKMQ